MSEEWLRRICWARDSAPMDREEKQAANYHEKAMRCSRQKDGYEEMADTLGDGLYGAMPFRRAPSTSLKMAAISSATFKV
jgi:hypothetical protein